MDPVGILKACTTNVRMKVARMKATTRDSSYSRATDFLKVGASRTSAFMWGAF
jgi:hypothetical protein